MIKTRFGSPVKIIAGELETGHVDVRDSNGNRFKTYLWELRADGGLKGIAETIKKLQSKRHLTE